MGLKTNIWTNDLHKKRHLGEKGLKARHEKGIVQHSFRVFSNLPYLGLMKR